MRKMLLIALLALAGCASQPTVDQAYVSMSQYAKESIPQAQVGAITWESRYVRLFELSAGIQNPILRNGHRLAYNDMIPTARRFDAHQISNEEFEDARRRASLRLEAAFDAARQEQAQMQAQQSAAMLQIFQNNQAQQNANYQQQMQQIQNNRLVNCTSNVYGNTVQTNCR